MDVGIQERLSEFIRRKGLRRTSQRDTIVKAAFSKDEHFTAEELFERARKLDSESSRATVYRTLSLLVEANLLRERIAWLPAEPGQPPPGQFRRDQEVRGRDSS